MTQDVECFLFGALSAVHICCIVSVIGGIYRQLVARQLQGGLSMTDLGQTDGAPNGFANGVATSEGTADDDSHSELEISAQA